MNFKALSLAVLCFAVGCGDAVDQTGEKPDTLPQWLLGTYSRGTRIEDSVTIESEDRAVRFEPGNKYAVRSGRTWNTATYDVSVTSSGLLFVDGPLKGKQLSYSSVSPNCRIIELDGEELFRGDVVAACPSRSAKALTASACDLAGTWRKTMRSGSLDGALFEVAVTVQVDSDRFFRRTQSSTSCAGGLCRHDETAPVVGTFDLSLKSGLEGFEHERAPGCELPVVPQVEVLPGPALREPVEVEIPAVTIEPKLYGACSSSEQCLGVCDRGQCTSVCKYDVQCATPGEGMIASCLGQRCVATCSTGNACPGGTACVDGLCL